MTVTQAYEYFKSLIEAGYDEEDIVIIPEDIAEIPRSKNEVLFLDSITEGSTVFLHFARYQS